jgi:hypothetical protein
MPGLLMAIPDHHLITPTDQKTVHPCKEKNAFRRHSGEDRIFSGLAKDKKPHLSWGENGVLNSSFHGTLYGWTLPFWPGTLPWDNFGEMSIRDSLFLQREMAALGAAPVDRAMLS